MTLTGLQMAGFFGVTTLVVVYSMCGIVSNLVISIFFGIFEFVAALYYGYLTYISKDSGLRMRIFYGCVAGVSLISAITNWSMHVKYFTEHSSTTRWFIVFFISLGLSANASVPWTLFTEKFMKQVILDNGFDEFTEQLVYLGLNVIIIILQACLMAFFGQITELEMVKTICLRSIGTVFCGFVVGGALGVYMGSKDSKSIGYVQPDEQ